MKIKTTGAENHPRYLKMLLAGDPGKGKTLFSSTAPNVLFLSIEGGTLSIDERHIPFVEIGNSQDFFLLLQVLQSDDETRQAALRKLGFKGPLDTVVVDTIDELSQILARERYQSQKRDSLSLPDYGWLKEQMKSITTALRNLDMHVIMTCHLRSRADEEGKNSILPAIEGGFAEKIAGYVDVAVLLQSSVSTEIVDNRAEKVIHRWIQVYADSLHEWIKDRSGKLPYEVPVDFKDDFMKLARMIWPDMGPTLSTATPEEVEAYKNRVLTGQAGPDPVPQPAPEPEVPEPEPEPQPEPVGAAAPAVPVSPQQPNSGDISAAQAKQAILAAAGQDGEKAHGAWRAAGLEGRAAISQEDLDAALRLVSLPDLPAHA
jgi:AAA domain